MMDLVNGYTLMNYAKRNQLVLPAFNTTNYEMTLAIVKAFDAMKLGGYIQISSHNLKLSNPEIVANMTREVMEREDVSTPMGLHLDHGKSFEDVKLCIDAGFTSIMVDASELPFEENIKEVKRATDYAHYFGVPVEAELGGFEARKTITCQILMPKPIRKMSLVSLKKLDAIRSPSQLAMSMDLICRRTLIFHYCKRLRQFRLSHWYCTGDPVFHLIKCAVQRSII